MSRPARPLAAVDAEQAPRLSRFRAGHPCVSVGRGEFGTWEAVVPQPRGGERFVSRHTLGGLLDRLDVLCDGAVPGD